MDKSAENSCTSNQSQIAEDLHQQFLDHHGQRLLGYLDGTSPSGTDPDALAYIEIVLDTWEKKFRHADLADPAPREKTFWFALYQLEELAEQPGPQIDPYESVLMQYLAEARELLRNRQPLPMHRFMATRPDGR